MHRVVQTTFESSLESPCLQRSPCKVCIIWSLADGHNVHVQAMGMMNKQMNLPALTKIMREFERQNEKMDMTSEMMGDAIDDAFEVRLDGIRYH